MTGSAVKNTENMLPACCSWWATPSAASAALDQSADLRRRLVDARVDVVGARPQRRQPGCGRDRVPGQRAGLVDGPERCEPRHHVGAATERRGREPATHHLAERHQVGAHAVQAEPARPADPEPGHHLVADEQGAVAPAELGQSRVEVGQRRHHAHVPGGRLGDDAGDLPVVRRERLLDRGQVVVGHARWCRPPAHR